MINVLINICVAVICALINGVTPSFSWLLVPLSLVEIYILALGISLLLGAINVKFRDIGSIWEVITQAMFYAVPIIYPISMVTASSVTVAKILLLNPVAQVIQDIRYNLVTTEAETSWDYLTDLWRIVPILIVIVLFTVSVLYFKRKAKYFAEEV